MKRFCPNADDPPQPYWGRAQDLNRALLDYVQETEDDHQIEAWCKIREKTDLHTAQVEPFGMILFKKKDAELAGILAKLADFALNILMV